MSAMEPTNYRRWLGSNTWRFDKSRDDSKHRAAESRNVSPDDTIPLLLSEVREVDQQQFACLAVSRWKSFVGRIFGLAVSVIAILAAGYNSDVRSALVDKPTISGAAGDRRAAHASSNASAPRSEAGAIVSDEYAALLTEVPTEHAENEAAPPKKLDAKTAAALTTRAKNLLALGDIAAARSLLERVANAHDATAAFLLAQTYDPTVLGVTDSRSITSDPVVACDWYRKAASFGSGVSLKFRTNLYRIIWRLLCDITLERSARL